MSGTIGDNVYRASGVVAAASAGISWQSVTTGSTLTAVAGNGYPIDTSSNACTITLPASASVGDEIIFTDYAGTWGTNIVTIDPNGLNYQSDDDTYTIEYDTDYQVLHIVYIETTQGWVPILDKAVTDVPFKSNDNGIFGYGMDSGVCDITNLVSNAGVVASDVTGVGTARADLAACEYGGDKGIFGYGNDGSNVSITNLVSNAGVVASDQAATTGSARQGLMACEYGGNKGIFGYGHTSGRVSMTNLVSSSGVVATDTTGVGLARRQGTACEYGGNKGIFGFGFAAGDIATGVTNLVSNAGVVASDVAAVGTARAYMAACSFN